MTKKYCKNCKYDSSFWHLMGKVKKEVYEKSTGRWRDVHCCSYIDNENNDCKYYEKKWYKFWVK